MIHVKHPPMRMVPAIATVLGVLVAQVVLSPAGHADPTPPVNLTPPVKTIQQIAASCPDFTGFGAGTATESSWAVKSFDRNSIWSITRGDGVIVAVVDSGVNFGHVQMQQVRRVPGLALAGKDTTDCYGHGTGVASIIAAQPATGYDFSGLAPGAIIMPIKIQQSHDSEAGEGLPLEPGAIRFAVDHGAKVINLSFNGQADLPDVRTALAYAEQHNVVVVGAADNTGQQTGVATPYPAAYPTVLTVASVNAQFQKSSFSTTGDFVKVAAPGEKVEMASPSPNDKKFIVDDGTSFAAPVVSAVAALVIATHPHITAAQVRQRIIETATPPPGKAPNSDVGYGIVNPYLSVTASFDDAAPAVTTRPQVPPVSLALAARTDDGPKHRSIAIGFALLGLAALTMLSGTFIRRGRRRHWRPASS